MKSITVEAKVATIVSNSQVAINIGSEEGVQIGSTAKLFRVIEVNDPDTNEPLGSVRIVKLNLRVTIVKPRFCVARVTDTAGNDNELDGILRLTGRAFKQISESYSSDPSNIVQVSVGEIASINLAVKED